MTFKRQLIITITILCLVSGVASPQAPRVAAYVEPGLLLPGGEALSVIVTAADSTTAARAVARAGGQVTSDLWLIDAVAATVPARKLAALAAHPMVRSVVHNKGVKPANGPGKKKDPIDAIPLVTDQAWPVAIDVGADALHQAGIKGDGVTVAIVDSGIFFSPDMISEDNQQTMILVTGQADFVGAGICRGEGDPAHETQYDGYCFQTNRNSPDGYGHGSHIGGIVGSMYLDAATGVFLGIAPYAEILSVRALNDDGMGSYEDVIEGIQYVVENQDVFNIRVLNLSLSAQATTPYFVDPLNRAAEAAWANGIVVVTAAGNTGPVAETVTVPGNDPYVITVGAIDTNRTPGDWSDDILPAWSATGPTLDGFAKPDVLAPGGSIVSFIINDFPPQ
jgi:serine protease AprX